MKERFTEEQIIGVLKESEAGLKPAELCRKHGISEANSCEVAAGADQGASDARSIASDVPSTLVFVS